MIGRVVVCLSVGTSSSPGLFLEEKVRMDLNNPVVKLCVEGTQAEFEGRIAAARKVYLQAWTIARDDYEACIAAHYVARHQENPQDQLHWNQEALARADAVGDERVRSFYPSLYVNMGYAYETLGHVAEARRYYELAAELGFSHQAELLGSVLPDIATSGHGFMTRKGENL